MSHSSTPTYSSWEHMRQRCNNPKNTHFAYYGGRGIGVCERWAHFINFLTDMGQRPDGFTLDRLNPDGNYEPGNCVWASRKDQVRNRRDTPKVDYHGLLVSISELCDILGISKTMVFGRLKYGWPLERALSEAPLTNAERSARGVAKRLSGAVAAKPLTSIKEALALLP